MSSLFGYQKLRVSTTLKFQFSWMIWHVCRWLENCATAISLPPTLLHARLVLYTVHDNRSGSSTRFLGLSLGWPWEQETQILFNVQHFQAWAMPSLLFVQPMRAQHGPSLPLDQQLYRLLEPQIFHSIAHLCAHCDLLRRRDNVFCLAWKHPMVPWCLLLQHKG